MNKYFFKALISVAVCLPWLICAALGAGDIRTWKAAEGTFQVQAEYISQTDTEVTLKRQDGPTITVPKSKLSAADLAWLKNAAAPVKAPAEEKPRTPTGKKTSTKSSPAKKSSEPATTSGWPFDGPLKLADDPQTQKPLPAPANTDYRALAEELLRDPARPTFKEYKKFPCNLLQPKTAQLAGGGEFLVDHDADKKQLVVWSITAGKVVATWNCGELVNPACFAISPSGKYLAMGTPEHVVRVWEVAKTKVVADLKTLSQAKEPERLLRVAFDWPDERVYFLCDKAKVYDVKIVGGATDFSSFINDANKNGFDPDSPAVELLVSGSGRIGVRLSEQAYESFTLPKMFAGAICSYPGKNTCVPVRHGHISRYGRSYFTRHIAQQKPGGKPSGMVSREALDMGDYNRMQSDAAEDYLWCLNVQENNYVTILDIYYLPYFEAPLRVQMPEKLSGLRQGFWFSAESKRLLGYDGKQLSVYQLSGFEMPAQWKVLSVFQRGFLEKRFDLLDGLTAIYMNDARSIPGLPDQPIMTSVIASFYPVQAHVTAAEWETRLRRWPGEQPKSDVARLVMSYAFLASNKAVLRRGNSPEVRKSVAENGKVIEEMLKPLLSRPAPPGEALYLQLYWAAQQDPIKQEDLLNISSKLAKVAPAHHLFHEQLIELMKDDPDDCQLYATTIANHFQDERGDILYARMALCGLKYIDSGPFFASKFDPLRVTRGIVADCKARPNDCWPFHRAHFWEAMCGEANRNIPDEKLAKKLKEFAAEFEERFLTLYLVNPYVLP